VAASHCERSLRTVVDQLTEIADAREHGLARYRSGITKNFGTKAGQRHTANARRSVRAPQLGEIAVIEL
jgi:hypothetical protein